MSLEGEKEEVKNGKNVAKDKPLQFKGEAGSNHLTKMILFSDVAQVNIAILKLQPET